MTRYDAAGSDDEDDPLVGELIEQEPADRLVLRERRDVGVDENIGVQTDHRFPLPRLRMARSMSSSDTGVAGFGRMPFRARMSPTAGRTKTSPSSRITKSTRSPG